MSDTINNALIHAGLRRKSQWSPQTFLDHLLSSPLTFLTSRAHRLLVYMRGSPAILRRPPGAGASSGASPTITVVCISDTHERTVCIPSGDLLIHAGDMVSSGSRAAIQAQLDWLRAQPHRYKVVVCGNHDSFFDPEARLEADNESTDTLDLSGIVYLQREAVTLKFDGGRKLVVFGAPDLPYLGGDNNAFQYHPPDAPWAGLVPLETDILVTHTPPKSHLDLGLGCPSLLREVWRTRPRLHVFGHVHWGAGREAVFFDAAQQSYEALMALPPRGLLWDLVPNRSWLLMAQTILQGINGFVFRWLMLGSAGSSGSLMVNAAQMYGDTGRMENKPQVVYL
ncbi:putative rhamnogalacturonate lyase C [Ceratocystis fimbriata CBS 114723]|uniref:Putative rhamnogalacturonate lyase C n=1 Tax=Ceratocystis fimbriata CBS 114723 TaxID=1035309 RepID=A0A2C5XI42_9PEZI|nr:putative rhamnogalacturonate lyase C [Ceratocystis fimbriata CBS 114723]